MNGDGTPQSDRPPGDGFEIVLVAIGGTVIALGFVTWAGARLAALLARWLVFFWWARDVGGNLKNLVGECW
jgi:hypothetical protein